MPSSDPVQRFENILDNIFRIERFTAGMDLQAFRENEETVYASKHALLIISEAAVKLGDLAPQLCPEIDWRDVRGLFSHSGEDDHRGTASVRDVRWTVRRLRRDRCA